MDNRKLAIARIAVYCSIVLLLSFLKQPWSFLGFQIDYVRFTTLLVF